MLPRTLACDLEGLRALPSSFKRLFVLNQTHQRAQGLHAGCPALCLKTVAFWAMVAVSLWTVACGEGGTSTVAYEGADFEVPDAADQVDALEDDEARPDVVEADATIEDEQDEPDGDTTDHDGGPSDDDVSDEEPQCVPSPEVCDGRDNDCDGEADEREDVAAAVLDDPEHCGACDSPCDFRGTQGACVDGRCVVSRCDVGHLNLDGDARNGCEVRVGAPRGPGIAPKVPERVVGFDPYYAVLDGDAVWLYLASTDELIDVAVLPGAVDAAYDASRGLLVVVGPESVSVMDVLDGRLRTRGLFEAPQNQLSRIALRGDTAYIANNFNQLGDSRLFVLDLSDPSKPVVAHREATLRGTTDLAIYDDDHLVTVSVSTGLSVYDISRPTRPSLRSFDDYQTFPSNGLALDTERALAYVIERNGDINIFDLSDFDAVAKVGEITERSFGQEFNGMLVDGATLWTTDLSRVRRFDTRNVQAPRRLSLSSMPGAGSLDRVGDRVMLTMLRGWSFPLNRYNINGGSVEPVSIDTGEVVRSRLITYDGEYSTDFTHLFKLGEFLLLIDLGGQSLLYRPTESSSGRLELGEPINQSYLGVHSAQVIGDRLHAVTWSYAPGYHQADYVVMEVNAQNPEFGFDELTRVTFPCYQGGTQPYDLTFVGDRALVICGGWDLRHVEQLDVSDPLTPVSLNRLESPIPIFQLAATPGQLITSVERRIGYRTAGKLDGYQWPVEALDAANWSYIAGGLPEDMALHGPLLYLKTANGLELMDMRIDSGYVPVALPEELPGEPLRSAPMPAFTEDMALLPTTAGLVALDRVDPNTDAYRSPRVLGRLSDQPLQPLNAVRFGDHLVILEKRRVLTLSLTDR